MCHALAVFAMATPHAWAEGPDSPAEVEFQVLAEGLKDPGLVVIRPGGSRSGPDLLFAERAAGRVLGIDSTVESPKVQTVLEGFDTTTGPAPASLVFRSRNRLLAALSGTSDQPALVCEYNLDDDRLPMDSSDRHVMLKYQSDSAISFTAMDRDHDGILLATGEHHWLLRGKLQDGPAANLKRFVKTSSATNIGNPTALVFSEKGYVVVSEAGTGEPAATCRLVFYHPVNQIAAPLMVLDTGLEHITDLAYSENTGNLYATNLAADSPERCGVYRLQATFDAETNQQTCNAVLVAQVDHPTSLAFANDGSLYITNAGKGQLLKGPKSF
ncbi:hypothetical protein Pan181_20080 [Aeoliella mucimassa]|uniref:SMP-30/Gluconolaconase/LRE-like region n=2 Tax=Aeoliella mucimassa TaxID=2527972 RepID=A0A518AM66_9BACT|nr:hypothetical protein Pan181_20080 [Aeoliella mucimassa]